MSTRRKHPRSKPNRAARDLRLVAELQRALANTAAAQLDAIAASGVVDR